ncbi:hypothetical protein ACJJTC_016019 [Scirpophaga incertulas]
MRYWGGMTCSVMQTAANIFWRAARPPTDKFGSGEQLSALFTTDSADWKCQCCAGNVKPKKLSFIMRDVEDEADTDTDTVTNPASMSQKMLNEIKREVRDVVRTELQVALQFYSDKIGE